MGNIGVVRRLFRMFPKSFCSVEQNLVKPRGVRPFQQAGFSTASGEGIKSTNRRS